MTNRIMFLSIILLHLLSTGCSHTKYLKDGEFLVKETSLNYTPNKNIKKNKEITKELLELTNPKPNSGFLKIPLMIHRLTQNRKEKGFKNYLNKKFAEKPSIYNQSEVNLSQLKMDKYLLDHGYIGSQVIADTIHKEKTISIVYSVQAKQRRIIKEITQISDTTQIGQILSQVKKSSKLKVGDFYSKDKINEERARLSNHLRNKGFINITDENFFFTVDTQFVEKVIAISINYKQPTEQEKMAQYKLGRTYIHSLSKDANIEDIESDTIRIKPGMYDLQQYEILRPKVLDLTIDQDSSDVISAEKQQLTLKHFISYGLFKFVNQKYSKPYGDSLNIIDRHIYLTPGPDASIGTEFELNNRSGNFFGSAITSTFSNYNTFKGAENFNVDLTLGTEAQFTNDQSLLNTFTLDVNLGLDVPRLLIPFFNKKPSTYYIPHTKFNFSNLYENRSDTYTALRSSLDFSYDWRETRKSNHTLSPISISYLDLLSTTQIFQERLDTDRRLFLSLQDVIDLGLEYTYTFTNQDPNRTKNYTYLNVSTRLSGNVLNTVTKTEDTTGRKIIFGTPFSQYAKLSFDYRYYIPIKKSQLVSRIHAGAAYAYGNADEVPYNEQFAVGGSNGLRGFNFRGLGPGSFVLPTDPNNIVENQFYDQTGDLLLEMNLEYRFSMVGFLKGAVFLDAGNVWLINDNQDKPGGQFEVNTFLKQIGLNTGYGFRFDFGFLLLRLDLGMVLRRPYFGEGFDWTYKRSNSFTRTWWSDNLNLQVGIGYPF